VQLLPEIGMPLPKETTFIVNKKVPFVSGGGPLILIKG
jgi:hypothetical protein